MILNFHVEIEVSDYYGEEHVPYIKQLFTGTIPGIGVKKVYYEGPTKKADIKRYEQYEKWLYEQGEIEL